MERDDRAPVASFFVESPFARAATTTLDENAAHHARVKRLSVDDVVRLSDGAGQLGFGSITGIGKTSVMVAVEEVRFVTRPPAIHVRAPIADRDRMLWLAEKATELGVTTWQGVRFRRSTSVSPRGEGAAFHEKLRARMVSALEQSGGAWLPELLPDVSLDALSVDAGQIPVVLDPNSRSLASVLASEPRDAEPVLLIGPEGGLEPDERSALLDAGWRTASLASTILRFETAGVAAIAVARAVQLQREN